MKHPIFSLNKIILNLKGRRILAIKNFEMHRGAIYLINGNMGSGKTSLINILNRKTKIKSGECMYEEKRISTYSSRNYNDQVAFVPQIFSCPFGTVERYLKKTLKKYSHITNIQKRFDGISSKMELSYLLDRKMSSLSPGQLRWVVLAANIAADTKVLLIDEIEQHLSKESLNKLGKILFRKSNYDGVTIIATTQNKELLSQRLASVIVTLDGGRISSVRSTSKKRKASAKKRR